MSSLPVAPAAERNTGPILGVLERELEGLGSVLEIGSGTGQHAVAAAARLPGIVWQPTELSDRLGGIRAHIAASGLDNVMEPTVLDVHRSSAPGRFDAVFTANTLHIVDQDGVSALVAVAAGSLLPGGLFLCYGPFRRQGAFSTPSNRAFDADLRRRGSGMGIRDLDEIDALCGRARLHRIRSYAMPANNLLLVWEKRGV